MAELVDRAATFPADNEGELVSEARERSNFGPPIERANFQIPWPHEF